MLNAVQLQTFAAVVDAGSFAAAAQRLGYTPSAISQQIQALERQIALTLFDRSARGIRPTSVALALLPFVQESLAALEQLDREIASLVEGRAGAIRIGSFPTASASFVPVAMSRFQRERPDVEIHLVEGEIDDLAPLVERGELDVALIYSYDLVPQRDPPEVQRLHVATESLVAIVPPAHPLSRLQEIDLEQLANETWVANEHGSHGERSLLRLCALAGYEPSIRYRSNDYNVVCGFVEAGFGVALVPELALLRPSPLKPIAIADERKRRYIMALVRDNRANPLVEPLLEYLRSTAIEAIRRVEKGVQAPRETKTLSSLA